MPSDAPVRLFNVNAPERDGLVATVTTLGPPLTAGNFIRNDGETLDIGLVRPSNSTKRRFDFVDPTGALIELAIGAVDLAPTAGTFDGDFDGDDTGLIGLDFDIAAADLQTALNSNPGVTAGSQTVAVTKLDDLSWKIRWSDVGAKELFSWDPAGLEPDCSATSSRLQTGDGSTVEIQLLRITRRPYAYQADWDSPIASSSVAAASVITTNAPHGLATGDSVTIRGHSGSTPSIDGTHTITVTSTTTFTIPVNVTVGGTGGFFHAIRITQAQTGSGTKPSIQRITLSPEPYDGVFSLNFSRANVVRIITKGNSGGAQEVSSIQALSDGAVKEVSAVQTVADVAGSLGGTYDDLYDASGAVRVWIDVDNGSTAPAIPSGGRLIEVDISADDSAATVATAWKNAVDADAAFVATVSANLVTITDASYGARTAIAAGTSAFTSARITAGVTSLRHDTVAATLQDADGPVQVLLSNGGTVTTGLPSGGRRITATIANADTASTIASAIASALDADSEFAATASGTLVTVTAADYMALSAVTSGTSGFSVARVTTGATSLLDQTSFTIYDDTNSSVAIYLSNTGDDPPDGHPALDASRYLIATMSIGDDADTVAASVEGVIDADPDFTTARTDNIITVTNVAYGARTAPDIGTTGFSVATTIEGLSVSATAQFDASAAALETALGNGFVVTKSGTFSWDITFPVTGIQNAFTANGAALSVPLLLRGELNLATAQCLSAFIAEGTDEIDALLEGQITWPGKNPQTFYQAPVTLKKDLIDFSTLYPLVVTEPSFPATFEVSDTVTGYTGGGATNLDGIVTAGVGYTFLAFDHATDGFRIYRRTAGTDAEASPGVIRPDDFHATTNAYVWKLKN